MTPYQRLGDWLVANGRLTPEQLETALQAQADSPMSLGKVMLEKGLISEHDLVDGLSVQYELPRANLCQICPQKVALKLVSPTVALARLVLPFRVTEHEVYCVVADPRDVPLTDELARETGLAVRLCLAPQSELYEAIARCYGLQVPQIGRASEHPARKRAKRPMKIDQQNDRLNLLSALEVRTHSATA